MGPITTTGKATASTLCVAPGQLRRGTSVDPPATEGTSTAVDLMTAMADTMITTPVGQEGK